MPEMRKKKLRKGETFFLVRPFVLRDNNKIPTLLEMSYELNIRARHLREKSKVLKNKFLFSVVISRQGALLLESLSTKSA
jgi:hypothetical protein